MKQRIRNFFQIINGSRTYSLLLLINFFIVSFGLLWFVQSSYVVLEQLLKLNEYEANLTYNLSEMKANVGFYVIVQEPEMRANYNDFNKQIDTDLEEFQEEFSYFDYSAAEETALDNFLAQRGRYDEIAQNIFSTVEANDSAEAARLFALSQEEFKALQTALDELAFASRTELNTALLQLPSDVRDIANVATFIIILLLLLAIRSFNTAGHLTQPILDLINGAMAIGGGRFRPELFANLKNRKDHVGRLAQELEQLAENYQLQEQKLEQELAELKENLRQSRRHRLYGS